MANVETSEADAKLSNSQRGTMQFWMLISALEDKQLLIRQFL
jgi:hypothetical protein